MSIISETDLKSQIKTKTFKNFYLLFGEENYLTEYYTNLLVSKISDGNKNDFNFKSFKKNKFNIDELEKSIEVTSFMSPKKCILIKDFEIGSLSSNNLKKFKEIITNLPEDVFLIISQVNIETEKKHSNSFNNFIRFAEKIGSVIELKKLSKMALEKQLISWAKKLSKELSLNNAELIINNCGNNLMELKSEIEKLCAYAEQEITSDIINKLVFKKLEANVFELTKLISANDFKNTLIKLNILLKMKESPIAILSILSGYYIDLYRVKTFENAGESIYNIKEVFSEYKNKEFRLTNAQRDCNKLPLESIKACISLLTDTDLKLKSSKVDAKILMEELLIKIFKIYNK